MNYLLILGASSDIAKAVAHRYARAGWSVYLAGRDPQSLAIDVNDIHIRYGVTAKALRFDVLETESHKKFFQTLLPKPVGVVFAVGTLGEQSKAQSDYREAKRILETNFVSGVSILNIAANEFESRKSGFIIGISSVGGERGRKSNYMYGSAKAGLTAYLSGLRNRLASVGVQVLTVKPGYVNTRMTEHLSLPNVLTASPAQVAENIFAAQQAGRDVVYSLWFWRWIMVVIRSIPERFFKKLSL